MDDARRERAADVLGTAAGILGAGALGPFGAFAAPVLRPAIERSIGELTSAYLGQFQVSAGEMLERAAGRLDVDVEEMTRRILADPRLIQVAGEALDAASRTILDHKIRGLARALASAIEGDDAQVDEDELIIHSLADLEAPHIKLLYAMCVMSPDGGSGRVPSSFAIRRLQEKLPHLGRPIRALLAPLEARACVAQEPPDVEAMVKKALTARDNPPRGGRAPASTRPDPPRWRATPHGQEVTNYLGRVELKAEHRSARKVRLRGGSRDGQEFEVLADEPLVTRTKVEDQTVRERYLPTEDFALESDGYVMYMDFDARVE